MPQSLAQIYVHIVFSTKDRRRVLTSEELRAGVHSYLAGVCREKASPALTVGGVEDHVHLLCRMSRVLSIADIIRELKKASSRWVKEIEPAMNEFSWQAGYGAFSVSPSHIDTLRTYIANQVQHHKDETFQDEFRRLCRKYRVDINERYAWE